MRRFYYLKVPKGSPLYDKLTVRTFERVELDEIDLVNSSIRFRAVKTRDDVVGFRIWRFHFRKRL